jgi:hypothetical protein
LKIHTNVRLREGGRGSRFGEYFFPKILRFMNAGLIQKIFHLLIAVLFFAQVAKSQEVIIFENANFGGRQKKLAIGTVYLPGQNIGFKVSSIKVPSNLVVLVHEKAIARQGKYYGSGKSKYLVEDCQNIASIGFSDVMMLTIFDKSAGGNPGPGRPGEVWKPGEEKVVNGKKEWIPGSWQLRTAAPKAPAVPKTHTLNGEPDAFQSFFYYDFSNNYRPQQSDNQKYADGAFNQFNKNQIDLIWESAMGINLFNKLLEKNPSGAINQKYVFYLKNYTTQLTVLQQGNDHIIVADTIFISNGKFFQNTTKKEIKKTFIKIISNVVVFDGSVTSIALLNYEGINNGDFQYSAKEILFRSRDSIIKYANEPPFPFFFKRDDGVVEGAPITRVEFGHDEKKFMNQWVVMHLETIRTKLNTESDEWEKDKLYSEFLRIKKIFDPNVATLQEEKTFNELAGIIKGKLNENNQVREMAIENGQKVKILVSPGNDFLSYYLLPNELELLPLTKNNNTLLGTISTAEENSQVNYKLEIDLNLRLDKTALEDAKKTLQREHSILLENTPPPLIHPAEQAFRINGTALSGKMYSISPTTFRASIELGSNTQQLKLIELFKPNGSNKLKLKTTSKTEYPFSIDASFLVEETLLKKLIETNYATSNFDAYIKTDQFTEVIILNSLIDQNHEFDGQTLAFDYLEVFINVKCENREERKGPFRLSSSSTYASRKVIYFAKNEPHCSIIISGKAVYDKGNASFQIKEFSPDSKLVNIHEGLLQGFRN